MKGFTPLLFAACFLPITLFADESVCSGMSEAERGICLDSLLRAEEERLSNAYEAAYAYINTSDLIPKKGRDEWRRAVDRARYAWATFRNAECEEILYKSWGGSGASKFVLECKVQMTTNRIAAIQRAFSTRVTTRSQKYNKSTPSFEQENEPQLLLIGKWQLVGGLHGASLELDIKPDKTFVLKAKVNGEELLYANGLWTVEGQKFIARVGSTSIPNLPTGSSWTDDILVVSSTEWLVRGKNGLKQFRRVES